MLQPAYRLVGVGVRVTHVTQLHCTAACGGIRVVFHAMHEVALYVYDLSHGLARQLSPAFLGEQVDGIWHTSVVAWNREIFFGNGVAVVSPPGTSHVRAGAECD